MRKHSSEALVVTMKTRTAASIGWLAVGLSFSLAACASQAKLVPLKGDSSVLKVATGAGDAGTEVIIEVEPNAWSGVPVRLRKVTPVLITIENKHSERIRLRYDDFVLKAADGREFRALPPLKIKATEWSRQNLGGLPPAGLVFGRYPFRGVGWGPGIGWGTGAFAFNSFYFGSYPYRTRHDLPTTDMVVKALPETVLEPQARLSGFLYFQNLERDLEKVEFISRIISADSGEVVAEVRLPFKVKT